jgi:small conductance mechanosensitive channel
MTPPSAETIEQTRRTLIDLSIRYGPKLLTAFVVLFVGVLASRRSGQAMQQWLAKRELEPPVRKLIGRVASLLVLLLFVLMALQNLGVELLPLFASLGVAGVGVGLAMQGVLSNLTAGLTIIFTRPFKVGEYVALVGVEGQVDSIELFSTTLLHTDCSRVVIPNRKIVGEILHNYGKLRQLDLSVSVAYAADLDKALRTIGEVLQQNPRVRKELTPVVGVVGLYDSAIQIAIKPWVSVADFIPAAGELNAAVVVAFRARQIEIPFPQREVRLLSPPAPSSLP